MIEVLPDMPQGVHGIRVSGRISGDDIRSFKPEMDQMLAASEIRFVEVIAPDYEGFGRGGLVEDLKQGFGLLFSITLRSSGLPSCRIGNGSRIRCTPSRGWFPAS